MGVFMLRLDVTHKVLQAVPLVGINRSLLLKCLLQALVHQVLSVCCLSVSNKMLQYLKINFLISCEIFRNLHLLILHCLLI